MQSNDDSTPTGRIWAPKTDLDKEQQAAFRAMLEADLNGDYETAAKHHQRIMEIEEEQKVAHAQARAHLLRKARGK